jgi:hypothetical protein
VKSRAHGVSICQILLRENGIAPFDPKDGGTFRDDKNAYFYFEKQVSLMQAHILEHFEHALDTLVRQAQTRNTASHPAAFGQTKLTPSSGLSRFISAASVVFGVDRGVCCRCSSVLARVGSCFVCFVLFLACVSAS